MAELPTDERVAEQLLELLRDDRPSPPPDLGERTMRTVRSSITARDLIDLTTFVFVARFCAPLIDLIASMVGAAPPTEARRDSDESRIR